MNGDTDKILSAIKSLEDRVTRLETSLSGASAPNKEEKKPPQEKPKESAGASPVNKAGVGHLLETKAIKEKPVDAEAKGGQLLASVAIFFFFLAAAMFVKLAIESGWLTPIRQFGALVMFAFGLLTSGVIVHHRDGPYSGFLTGAGVAMLYFAAYVGNLYFGLYSEATTVMLVSLIGLSAIGLFKHFGHEYFLLAAVAGSYLVPLLLGGEQNTIRTVGCYFLLLGPVFCAFAFMLNNRRLIAYTAYFAVLVFHAVYLDSYYSRMRIGFDPAVAALVQGIQFMVFSVCVTAYSVKTQVSLKSAEAWGYFPVLVLFYSSEYHMLSAVTPEMAPWIALVFAGVIALLYFAARFSISGPEFQSGPMVTAFVALVLAHAGYLELLPSVYAPFVVLLVLVVLHSKILISLNHDDHWITYLIVYAIAFIEYWKVLLGIGDLTTPIYTLNNCVYALVIGVAYFLTRSEKSNKSWLLWLGILQALFALHRLAGTWAPDIDLYLTSGLWALLSLALLISAVAIKDKVLGKAAGTCFLLVSLKVFFIDIASEGTITKIITLLVVGSLVYVGGFYVRKLNAEVD